MWVARRACCGAAGSVACETRNPAGGRVRVGTTRVDGDRVICAKKAASETLRLLLYVKGKRWGETQGRLARGREGKGRGQGPGGLRRAGPP